MRLISGLTSRRTKYLFVASVCIGVFLLLVHGLPVFKPVKEFVRMLAVKQSGVVVALLTGTVAFMMNFADRRTEQTREVVKEFRKIYQLFLLRDQKITGEQICELQPIDIEIIGRLIDNTRHIIRQDVDISVVRSDCGAQIRKLIAEYAKRHQNQQMSLLEYYSMTQGVETALINSLMSLISIG